MYINDLPLSLDNAKVTMYADDTSISYSSNSVDAINSAFNEDLMAGHEASVFNSEKQ